MKALIFDSGPIINLSMNSLLYVLKELKKIFAGKFLITEAVKYEIVDRPLKIPRFELGALQIKELIDSNIIEFPSSLKIDSNEIKKETQNFMTQANNCTKVGDRLINIISEAETSCLALSQILTKQKIENIIAIDERTTRILTEKPQNLEKIMSDKLHTQVIVSCDLNSFQNFKFIRSTELAYVAYKKGLLKINDQHALEAALYATKFKGSSVSYEEIRELKKL